MHDAEVMQDQTYNAVKQQLEAKMQQLEQTQENMQKLKQEGDTSKIVKAIQNDQNLRQMLGSIQAFWAPDKTEAERYDIEEDQFIGKVFPLLLKEYEKQLKYDGRQIYSRIPGATSQSANTPAPYEILDKSAKDAIRLDEKGKVYVVNMEAVQRLQDGGSGTQIDQLNKYMNAYATALNDLKTQNSTSIKLPDGTQITKENFEASLQKVFNVLTDENGNEVCWLDLQGYEIIQDSKLQGVSGKYTQSGGVPEASGWVNECGHDVKIQNVIGQSEVTVAYMRVEELNKVQVNELLAAAKSNQSSRMIMWNGNFYLFAYPIAVVDEIKLTDDGNYTIQYKVDNNVLVQLIQQNTLKVNGTSETQTQTDSPYISVGDGNQKDKQQFILNNGDLTGEVNLAGTADRNKPGNQHQSDTVKNIPVFILRDYLEAQFTPGVLNDGAIDEQLVCYGRLIRLKLSSKNNDTYNISDPIGYYVDQNHDKIQATGFQDIYVHQLADGKQLNNSVQVGNSLNRLPQKLEQVGQENQGDAQAQQVQQLPNRTVNQIFPVMSFPGQLDAWDKDMTDKPQMYAIATCLDLNTSGLLSHWIQSDEEDKGLIWWQKWLNDHRYNYKLTTESVNKWVNAEYDIQLSDRNFVIVDLDRTQKQNDIFQKKVDEKLVTTLRTVAMLIGAVAEIYGVILILAWTFDTNIGLGIGALEKAQFGHWTAIKYRDDIPYNSSQSGPRPMTFQDVIIKILIIAAVGAALLTIDLADIVAAILKIFYGFTKILEQVLTGLF